MSLRCCCCCAAIVIILRAAASSSAARRLAKVFPRAFYRLLVVVVVVVVVVFHSNENRTVKCCLEITLCIGTFNKVVDRSVSSRKTIASREHRSRSTNTVKEEKEDNTWPDAGKDHIFNSVASSKDKKFKTFSCYKSPAHHMYEVMTLQEKIDKKIFVDFECEDLKSELTPLSTRVCKSEHQKVPPVVKMENDNQTNDINENIFIDFKYKLESQPELKSLSTTICKNEYQSCLPTVKIENQKSFVLKGDLKCHFNAVHDRSRPFECEICQKSFRYQSQFKTHINAVHNRSKPFECDICHKSFGRKGDLARHINAVHDQTNLLNVTFVTNHLDRKVTSNVTSMQLAQGREHHHYHRRRLRCCVEPYRELKQIYSSFRGTVYIGRASPKPEKERRRAGSYNI
uniref:C2H2-type domain-containing protein n=1 Tax=Trichogramma kaykai TaxID=54128 RepID=A0ABD2XJ78_9HYME